jgi:NADH-quinone oxidoreductase subunit I
VKVDLLRDVAKPVVSGLGITAKRAFHKKVTISYPDEQREQYPRTRWRHFLTRYEDGLEKCIGCSLCAGACPARCIYVEAAENTEEQRFSPGERYAARYEINMLRCIFCGYCQEACPTGAIVLRKNFELADYEREDFIYTKEQLLEKHPGEAEEPYVSVFLRDREEPEAAKKSS